MRCGRQWQTYHRTTPGMPASQEYGERIAVFNAKRGQLDSNLRSCWLGVCMCVCVCVCILMVCFRLHYHSDWKIPACQFLSLRVTACHSGSSRSMQKKLRSCAFLSVVEASSIPLAQRLCKAQVDTSAEPPDTRVQSSGRRLIKGVCASSNSLLRGWAFLKGTFRRTGRRLLVTGRTDHS